MMDDDGGICTTTSIALPRAPQSEFQHQGSVYFFLSLVVNVRDREAASLCGLKKNEVCRGVLWCILYGDNAGLKITQPVLNPEEPTGAN